MEHLNLTQLAVYKLVKAFVERQKIVFDAMMELHPRLMSRYRVIPLQPEQDKWPMTFIGDWGEAKEWNYFLHGAGCRLIHKLTGEPIEWDASDVKRFDSYWFTKWVEWYLEQEHDDESIRIIKLLGFLDRDRLREFISDNLSQLHNLGLLERAYPASPNPTKYVVV